MCLNPKYAYKVKDDKFNWSTLNISKYKLRFITKAQYYYWDKERREGREHLNVLKIPCTKCIECRANHAKEWAVRAYMETKQNPTGIFLTLSYDNKHLPIGELGNPTLRKRDITLFKKRLRERTGATIKTFECGEYGEKRGRPHYHMIIWNWKPTDERLIKQNISGDSLFNSQYLEKIWSKGLIIYGNISYESAAYVARYVNKKKITRALAPDQEETYINMSRKEGIGKGEWTINHEKYQKLNSIYVPTKNGTKICKIPRYYLKQWEKELKKNENREREELTKNMKEYQERYKNYQKITLEQIKEFFEEKELNKPWYTKEWEKNYRLYNKMINTRKDALKRIQKYYSKKNQEIIYSTVERNQIWRQAWEQTPLYTAALIRQSEEIAEANRKLETTDLSAEEYDKLHIRNVIEKIKLLKRGLDN